MRIKANFAAGVVAAVARSPLVLKSFQARLSEAALAMHQLPCWLWCAQVLWMTSCVIRPLHSLDRAHVCRCHGRAGSRTCPCLHSFSYFPEDPTLAAAALVAADRVECGLVVLDRLAGRPGR